MTERIVFIDIDHTIAAAWWRDSRLGDWEEYHQMSEHDKPIVEMLAMINSLHDDGWWTVALTGRPLKFQQVTMIWCLKHGALLDDLVMRPDADFDKVADLKVKAIKEYLRRRAEAGRPPPLVVVFEDRDDVVAALKDSQINCIICQVNMGGSNGQEAKAQTGSYCGPQTNANG